MESNLKLAFETLDKNKDGVISVSELKHCEYAQKSLGPDPKEVGF
jgi:Ca2+-binding EF-hand superfamily protein